jgi:hypothetical protein
MNTGAHNALRQSIVRIAALIFAAVLVSAAAAQAQSQQNGSSRVVDGVAVRIESDIITESELGELAKFQQLVQGQPAPRSELINELIDQWIVKNEAQSSQFLRPLPEEIDKAFADLSQHFASPAAFQQHIAEVGLSEKEVRRQLALQIYLDRFLDYRFRAAAQVDEKQVQDYYENEFTKQAQAHSETVPPLDNVHTEIRQVLIERVITDKSEKWLTDTRARLHIEILKTETPSTPPVGEQ